MPDFVPKVHKDNNGDQLVVETGGKISVLSGGTIDLADGSTLTIGGTQIAAIVDLTAATGTAGDTIADVGGAFAQATLNNNFKRLADKVNLILQTLRDLGAVAS
jgi:hypothetical protein